jgi:hypothetical protein
MVVQLPIKGLPGIYALGPKLKASFAQFMIHQHGVGWNVLDV